MMKFVNVVWFMWWFAVFIAIILMLAKLFI